tara:strand:- start:108 stop:533 length:426 start_codon:yes stop_codon:yes gene_type:complete
MKKVFFIFLVFNLSYGQVSSVEGISSFYKNKTPLKIDNETILIDVNYDKVFFTYTYRLLKNGERLKAAKLVLKMILSEQISKSVNSMQEFLTIRKTKRNLVFFYRDIDSKPAFTIVYSVNSLNKYQRNESLENKLESRLMN